MLRKLLLLLSLALVAILVVIGRDVADPEWKQYQRAYFDLAMANARTEAERAWAEGQRLEIRQVEVKGLGRVDRCTTCHLAIEDPRMTSAPEPLRAHSALVQSHPPQRLGCTICHGGEGRAVTSLAAHGEQGEEPSRLLKGELIQAACFGCHGRQTLPPRDIAAVIRGERLVNQYKCLRCHQVRGQGGSEGPDLSTVGSRRDWVWTYAHLLNPQAMSPGSTMPDYPLTGDEARDMTAYLLTLRGPDGEVHDRRFLPQSPAPPALAARQVAEEVALRGLENIPAPVYRGETLFWGAGCGNCHAIGRRGGEVGPALTYIGRSRDAEWLERWLKDPAAVVPGARMPRSYLNERQIRALVEYLGMLGK